MANDYMVKSGTLSMQEVVSSAAEVRSSTAMSSGTVAAAPLSPTKRARADMDEAAKRYGAATHRVVQKRYAVK